MTPDSPLVLHVIHHLVTGGMENGLVNLIENMPANAFRHAILCVEDYSDFRNRLTRTDVEVTALHRSQVGIGRVRREIYKACRRLRPALLHTRNMSALDALLPARVAGVRRCIHGEHGWDVADLRGNSRKQVLLRRVHSPLIDRYVTVSTDLRRYLIERVKIPARRIEQIYNGVDTERFTPATIRQRANLFPAGFADASHVVIGAVGRAQPVKDQATLLRAFATLLERRPDLRSRLRLAIVGDGPLFGALNALASELRIAQSTWLPGSLLNVPDVLRSFDVFVLPSLNEGISNTVLEAMASGLPVIATAVGGTIEIVEEGRWGRLFAPGDVGTLAACIEGYVDQPAMREAHARAARAAATRDFALATMVGRYQALYESMLRLPGAGQGARGAPGLMDGASNDSQVQRTSAAATSAASSSGRSGNG